ncbi:MAG TPA: transketolase [Candidatus Magasanikbacteria bacterium]|nr:transketolase [Candidatus Magasanikbacteria bacterium]
MSVDKKILAQTFAQSCRASILEMTAHAGSGHPGGSLSSIDYLSVLYTSIISQTGEPVFISNGHISPAVYSVLAEMGWVSKKEMIEGFRKCGSKFEGHVTRHVPGVWYGTGPLAIGLSVACGTALGYKIKKLKQRVYAVIGDGEGNEGQIYEAMNFAHKYKLDNLIVMMDYNHVQLSDATERIMPYNPVEIFKAGGWNVLEIDGHNYDDIFEALEIAKNQNGHPTFICASTIMGKGVDFMEADGADYKATWHGKAPSKEQIIEAVAALSINPDEEKMLKKFRKSILIKPPVWKDTEFGAAVKIKSGKVKLYAVDTLTDCRSAYGVALVDLAKLNKNIVALTADLGGSVKTDGVQKTYPNRHIECGVAEQLMVSASAGLEIAGFVPFCSTFGAFMTSRAKDQARVNDINETNVKMVATHCGLSVGEDGPTHQAIDDSSSVVGFFNTMQLEPADPNHCDRLVRFAATHQGNVYMRMGRHKIPVLTTGSGKPFYNEKYVYTYGKTDVLRKGDSLTIVAMGGVVVEALHAWEQLKSGGVSVEVIIASSIKAFDETVFESIKKTGMVITVEDHNPYAGLGGMLARECASRGIVYQKYEMLGVREYQLSGTAEELYHAAGIDTGAIVAKVKAML